MMCQPTLSFRRRAWLAALVASGLALGPVAGAVSSASAAEAVQAPPAQSAVGRDYVIGPGDTVEVYVWRDPELTVTVPVRPDGKITTPLVTDMVAVGKTPTQLAHDIETVLAEYVRSPEVDIIVTKTESAFSQVQVIGQVKKPQAVPYRQGMRVLDALLAVGGLTDFAAGNRTRLVRTENGKQVQIRIKLDRLMNGGDMSQNLPLRPGDVLVIPESRF